MALLEGVTSGLVWSLGRRLSTCVVWCTCARVRVYVRAVSAASFWGKCTYARDDGEQSQSSQDEEQEHGCSAALH